MGKVWPMRRAGAKPLAHRPAKRIPSPRMPGRTCASMLAVAAVATLAAAAPAAARNGDLDPSFGTGGTVTADFGGEPGSDGGNNVVLLPKGRILTSGTGRGNGVGLALYRRDGTLDPAFAGGGQVYYQLNPGGSSYGTDARLAPSGKILLGG